jgi:hypothetical protein
MSDQQQFELIKQLKRNLLNTILEQRPEEVVPVFSIAAIHGDVEALDFIMAKVGNSQGNLEEMQLVRDSVAQIVQDIEQTERDLEKDAAQATSDLLKKFQL